MGALSRYVSKLRVQNTTYLVGFGFRFMNRRFHFLGLDSEYISTTPEILKMKDTDSALEALEEGGQPGSHCCEELAVSSEGGLLTELVETIVPRLPSRYEIGWRSPQEHEMDRGSTGVPLELFVTTTLLWHCRLRCRQSSARRSVR